MVLYLGVEKDSLNISVNPNAQTLKGEKDVFVIIFRISV